MALFQYEERSRVYMKMALQGSSGSGKTFSALLLAMGFAGEEGKVALMDTENRSSLFYKGRAGIPNFALMPVSPPFTVDEYLRGVKAAVEEGFQVLVIDSLSHVWASTGGLLDQKDALDRASGPKNAFNNWQPIKKQQEKLKAGILQAPIHVIVTMRSKSEYSVDAGKVQKIGMKAIQEDGMEYEFTTVVELNQNHEGIASKDRTGLFDTGTSNYIGTITADHGRRIMEWLNSAPEAELAQASLTLNDALRQFGDAATAKGINILHPESLKPSRREMESLLRYLIPTASELDPQAYMAAIPLMAHVKFATANTTPAALSNAPHPKHVVDELGHVNEQFQDAADIEAETPITVGATEDIRTSNEIPEEDPFDDSPEEDSPVETPAPVAALSPEDAWRKQMNDFGELAAQKKLFSTSLPAPLQKIKVRNLIAEHAGRDAYKDGEQPTSEELDRAMASLQSGKAKGMK